MKKKIAAHEVHRAKVFKPLASVIGTKEARKALRRISKTEGVLWDEDSLEYERLSSCFIWSMTFEGFEYWSGIERILDARIEEGDLSL